MKAIILAAGQGTRLRPLTDDRPKCMVEYCGKPIIDYILGAMKDAGIDDIAVVGGYKIDILKDYLKDKNLTFFENKNYETTNMVSTLFCAKEWLDGDDVIISYADIVYSGQILRVLVDELAELSTLVDKEWLSLWSKRMDNPLSDAETLKLDENENIIELGKKPKSYDEIEGQYIGLVRISKNAVSKIVDFYNSLSRDRIYDGKDFDNMYMTSFLQMIIDELMPVKAVFTNGGWVEIDSTTDLSVVFGG